MNVYTATFAERDGSETQIRVEGKAPIAWLKKQAVAMHLFPFLTMDDVDWLLTAGWEPEAEIAPARSPRRLLRKVGTILWWVVLAVTWFFLSISLLALLIRYTH